MNIFKTCEVSNHPTVFFPGFVYGQLAKFYADTTSLMEYNGHGASSVQYGMKMHWIIKGQLLRWGSLPIEVSPTESGVDTIFFNWHDDANWDTLLCKIESGSNITFVYNTCCDYFDVVDSYGVRFEGRVSLVFIGAKPGKKKYLGSIDDNGIFITSQADTIHPIFRSPMLPNRYNVEVKEVKNCSGRKCHEAAIRNPDRSHDVVCKFRIVDSILNFHYLPVSVEPIEVIYKVESGKVVIR